MSAETKAEKWYVAEVYYVSHAIANALLGVVSHGLEFRSFFLPCNCRLIYSSAKSVQPPLG